jgi:hypothetical protein
VLVCQKMKFHVPVLRGNIPLTANCVLEGESRVQNCASDARFWLMIGLPGWGWGHSTNLPHSIRNTRQRLLLRVISKPTCDWRSFGHWGSVNLLWGRLINRAQKLWLGASTCTEIKTDCCYMNINLSVVCLILQQAQLNPVEDCGGPGNVDYFLSDSRAAMQSSHLCLVDWWPIMGITDWNGLHRPSVNKAQKWAPHGAVLWNRN